MRTCGIVGPPESALTQGVLPEEVRGAPAIELAGTDIRYVQGRKLVEKGAVNIPGNEGPVRADHWELIHFETVGL